MWYRQRALILKRTTHFKVTKIFNQNKLNQFQIIYNTIINSLEYAQNVMFKIRLVFCYHVTEPWPGIHRSPDFQNFIVRSESFGTKVLFRVRPICRFSVLVGTGPRLASFSVLIQSSFGPWITDRVINLFFRLVLMVFIIGHLLVINVEKQF